MKRGWQIATFASLLWCVLSYVGYRLWGSEALRDSLIALLLCLVPTLVALWGSERFLRRSGNKSFALLIGTLGASGFRMVTVLAGGLILAALEPAFQRPAFWLWVLVFYVFLLLFEVAWLIRQAPRTEQAIVQ